MQKIPRTIRLVFVNEVTIQNAEHLGGFLVQVRRDECTGFHPDMYHRRTKRVVSIQGFYLDVSCVAWKRQVHCDPTSADFKTLSIIVVLLMHLNLITTVASQSVGRLICAHQHFCKRTNLTADVPLNLSRCLPCP